MNGDRPFEGAFLFLAARWPAFLLAYGGGALIAAILVARGLTASAVGSVTAGLIALLLFASLFATSVWLAQRRFDRHDLRPANILFSRGQLQSTDSFVHVGLGRRFTPARLARRLTSGHVTVIDVYNPQMAPARALARERRHGIPLAGDPRLTYLDGSISLLPLPDNHSPTVTMSHTLSELWEHGDRLRLLGEVRRVLEPGGQLLIAENFRTPATLALHGIAAFNLPRPTYWKSLLQQVGLEVEHEEHVAGLFIVFLARKRLPGQAQQLTLDFGL